MNEVLNPEDYQSKFTKEQMCEMYPTIDSYRLGCALVSCIFVLGLPL